MSKTSPDDVKVVITGIGTINPLGSSVAEYWANLKEGKNAIRLARNVDVEGYHSRVAGEIDIPDVMEHFSEKKALRRYDRYILFAQIAASQAVKDSGINIDENPYRFASLMGSGDGGIGTHYTNVERIVNSGLDAASPFYCINAIPNTATAYIAKEFGMLGPGFSMNSACATGNHSIGLGVTFIKMGMVDGALVGGSEAPVNRSAIPSFGNIGALSERNDSPETASRPFDVDRDGFVIAEGSGALFIESEEHARKRGAQIYGEVKGFGFTCDGYDLVAPHPEGTGASAAIKEALSSAGLNPEDIDLVNAHGTSTPLGDEREALAINKALGDYGSKVPVHSTKSMIGHMLGGASAAEAVADIMALREGVVHPSINVFEQDPKIDLTIVKETMEKPVDHLMSNAFGFGGQNAVVIFSRYDG